jgi:peptidoglycan/LPS O-acetylase OafA/YrhL
MRRAAVAFGAVLLVALPAAAAPIAGVWTLAVSGLMLVCLAAVFLTRRQRLIARLAAGCALAGTLIGSGSAVQAFLAVGADPAYSGRRPMGALALLFALLAGAGGLATRWPAWLRVIVMVGSALLGVVAINLFDINTFYVLAVPFWLLSAALVLVGAPPAEGRAP